MQLTEAMTAFAVRTRYDAIDGGARRVGLLSLLDWIAVGHAGRNEPVSRIVLSRGRAEGGAAQASVFGGGQRLPARAAAWINGTIGHAIDYDDTHFIHIGHPTAVVGSAALAAAQAVGASGPAFLSAYLVGFEASCRIGRWLGRPHYEAGFHQTATAGAFGATLAAGRLMGLDAATMAHAIGLASTRASGLKSQFGTMGKPLNAGFAAANGVECAALAAAALISNPGGLETGQGFSATHHGAAGPVGAALDGLGGDWLVTDVAHKFHACCHGIHAALEALGDLMADGLNAEDVSSLRITVHPRWLDVCNIERPATGLEAKFSYRMAAAMALAGLGTSALDSFRDDVCDRADLAELRDRVEVAPDGSCADTAARVDVLTRHGRKTHAAHDLSAPLPLAARENKVLAKARALLGRERADLTWRTLRALDEAGCVSEPAGRLMRA